MLPQYFFAIMLSFENENKRQFFIKVFEKRGFKKCIALSGLFCKISPLNSGDTFIEVGGNTH